ncbi:capsular polysaccharide biosynthesis protein-like protein [Asticcacaulis biprosthecium C19]|uniref:Capsular polysaccharide biosynthesis protein-like protein n=1 Tax=Asticcacaulis biprosthecium C19 TaxID=715226 RepID=F4QJ98_9CAUL|nr:capsular polysaccharide biosynthesis protein-like protein [Asticcacaulis biprosthecium C19]
MQEPPAIEKHYDVTYFPLSRQVWYDKDPNWGVYGADGHLIDAAALRRGNSTPPRLCGQSRVHAHPFPTEFDWAEDIEYIYMGCFISHYGHYLCSTLVRLWPLLREGLNGRKLLLHAPNGPDHEFRIPYAAMTLEGLGLKPDDIVVFQEPRRIRRLIIPRPSFVEQLLGHHAHRDLCHRIGEQFLDGLDMTTALPPVYFSKTKLLGGVGRIGNESVIENVLASNGIGIVYPEQLSLREQVRLFAENRVIAGTGGTQLHTGILAPPVARVVALSASHSVNSNLLLFDRLNDRTAGYVYDDRGYREMQNQDKFLTSDYLEDPEATAHDLLALIREL